jgi:hypothetical protein
VRYGEAHSFLPSRPKSGEKSCQTSSHRKSLNLFCKCRSKRPSSTFASCEESSLTEDERLKFPSTTRSSCPSSRKFGAFFVSFLLFYSNIFNDGSFSGRLRAPLQMTSWRAAAIFPHRCRTSFSSTSPKRLFAKRFANITLIGRKRDRRRLSRSLALSTDQFCSRSFSFTLFFNLRPFIWFLYHRHLSILL